MSANNKNSEISPLQQTALYSLHHLLGAKLVPFSSYVLPVQYAQGIKAEHLHTRKQAGLFDVSHMGQIFIQGESADREIEKLVSGDISGLKEFQQRYTLLTNEQGGIIDDLMVTRMPEGLFLVVNAACKQNDYEYIRNFMGPQYRVEMMENRALLALQGPRARAVLADLNVKVGKLTFLSAGQFVIKGVHCIINCCGYTGEDGFEISVDNSDAEKLAKLLLEYEDVKPVGLGARDSLRLEAGLCLYGHDIDASTTPIEANLRWAVASKYRNEQAQAGFPGADIILQQVRSGTQRQLVGIRPEGKIPVREGTIILDKEKLEIGRVTSGGFAASVGGPVAMAYLPTEFTKVGTEIHVEIRGRSHTMRVAELPFVRHQYYKL